MGAIPLVGLGFTAALADRGLLIIYQGYLQRFLMHGEGNFREHQGAKTAIAQATAEMVQLATQCFRYLNYPPYYLSFFQALRDTWRPIHLFDAQQSAQLERILLKLS